MFFVVAYDIANPQRLRRVARVMERLATRCQKSVFIFRGNLAELQTLLDKVAPLLKLEDDIVQAWKISSNSGIEALSRGTPANIYPKSVVLDPHKHRFIGEWKP